MTQVAPIFTPNNQMMGWVGDLSSCAAALQHRFSQIINKFSSLGGCEHTDAYWLGQVLSISLILYIALPPEFISFTSYAANHPLLTKQLIKLRKWITLQINKFVQKVLVILGFQSH